MTTRLARRDTRPAGTNAVPSGGHFGAGRWPGPMSGSRAGYLASVFVFSCISFMAACCLAVQGGTMPLLRA